MAEICKDILQLDKDTREGLKVFLEECTKEGLRLRVTETYRTVERQKELYAQGRTTKGKIVTNCDGVKNMSIHQTRRAFDVCNTVGDPYNKSILSKAGQVGTELGFIWGGSWGWDSPHFELPKGKKVKVKDDVLQKAVTKIVSRGIQINVTAWNDVSKVNLKNVPALLIKLGGLDKLVKDGVISNHNIWVNGSYNANNVRSLLIKYASKLA